MILLYIIADASSAKYYSVHEPLFNFSSFSIVKNTAQSASLWIHGGVIESRRVLIVVEYRITHSILLNY